MIVHTKQPESESIRTKLTTESINYSTNLTTTISTLIPDEQTSYTNVGNSKHDENEEEDNGTQNESRYIYLTTLNVYIYMALYSLFIN